jgi:hypothetical protein
MYLSSASIILSLLDTNAVLGSMFSNTLSLYYSLNVRDQVSHPYKPTGKLKFCVIKFLDTYLMRRQKIMIIMAASTGECFKH